MSANDGDARLRRLDSRPWLLSLFAAVVALAALGLVRSPHPYGGARFVIGYVGTELQITALLLLATVLLFPARRIGLCPPRRANLSLLLPLLALMAVVGGVWVATWQTLPAGARLDAAERWLILRTTALVGLNEEWLFRGLLLAAACRWWGLQRGALAALLAFGSFHLINVLGGVPPVGALFQFVLTSVVGAVFLMAALGTRSLLLPMIGHALYDWAVFDIGRMVAAGASAGPSLATPLLGLLLGSWCLHRLAHLPPGEPYGP